MCVAAANYVVEKINAYNERQEYSGRILLTCKRLQKLLYFCDVEFMKRNNGLSMFRDEYYAWPSGPVIPSVYYEFMQYQTGEMKPIGGEHTPLTPNMQSVIDFVLDKTCNMDTLDLVNLSHIEGGPWQQVYDADDPKHEQVISKESIFNFYKKVKVFS